MNGEKFPPGSHDRWLTPPNEAPIPHHADCPRYYKTWAKCECARLEKPHCSDCDGAPDGGHTGEGDCLLTEDK